MTNVLATILISQLDDKRWLDSSTVIVETKIKIVSLTILMHQEIY